MSESNSSQSMPEHRDVVLHSPGPAWKRGVNFREQPGVQAHVAYFHQLFDENKLRLGGPFLLPDSGGMMVTTKGVDYDALVAFVEADPAIQSGLLLFDWNPWFTAMELGA